MRIPKFACFDWRIDTDSLLVHPRDSKRLVVFVHIANGYTVFAVYDPKRREMHLFCVEATNHVSSLHPDPLHH